MDPIFSLASSAKRVRTGVVGLAQAYKGIFNSRESPCVGWTNSEGRKLAGLQFMEKLLRIDH